MASATTDRGDLCHASRVSRSRWNDQCGRGERADAAGVLRDAADQCWSLWLIPIAAVAALAVEATDILARSASGPGRGVAVAVLGGVAALACIIAHMWTLGQAGRIGVPSQVFSVLGTGFWLGRGVVAARVAVTSR